MRDLTSGSILKSILFLASPIVVTAFFNIAYNVVDMIWVGQLGEEAVSAIGSGWLFLIYIFAIAALLRTGVEVGVSQSFGARKKIWGKNIAHTALFLGAFLGLLFGLCLFFLSPTLISFLNMKNEHIISMSVSYMKMSSLGCVPLLWIPVFSAICNASGNSKIPFYFQLVGFLLNFILDPFFILGIGPFPRLEVAGAALASVISQVVTTCLFLVYFYKSNDILEFNLRGILSHIHKKTVVWIFKKGFPPCLQSAMFTCVALVLARNIARWGDLGIGVQRVGINIESLSWMTASGLSFALTSFTGQNFGAKEYSRVQKATVLGLLLAFSLGMVNTVIFMVFSKDLYRLFVDQKDFIDEGVLYLYIIGLSQVFMCIEIVGTGMLNGIGKTSIPSIVSIIFTAARIPLAFFLCDFCELGLVGNWWAISISSMVKGVILFSVLYYFFYSKNFKNLTYEDHLH